MDRLIVKNFGPLKDVDIELNKINLFIGENGSGKSVLGKLLNILKNLSHEINIQQKDFEEHLKSFGISYLQKNTLLRYFIDDKLFIEFKENKFDLKKYDNTSKTNIKALDTINTIIGVMKKLDSFNNVKDEVLNPLKDELNKALKDEKFQVIKDLDNVGLKAFESILHEMMAKEKSHYIPAERNLISIFSSSMFSFISSNLPTPKYLIEFGSQFELARNQIKTLDLLNVKYVYENSLDKVFFSKTESLPLDKSSSAVQSVLPLRLVVEYLKMSIQENKNAHIIIEEPELNLFPKAQLDTLKAITEDIPLNSSLFIMTHSPYMLSTLNILMMAYKTANLNEKAKTKVVEFIDEKQWINPNDFSAYYLENGIARDIKGRTGLISDNEIDEISDDIQCEFEELLSIFREHKNDK